MPEHAVRAGGGAGANGSSSGGGAGLGGAIFIRAGSTSFDSCSFTGNTATRGDGSSAPNGTGANGQGKGSAVFVHVPGGASATDLGSLDFSGNSADDAGVAPNDNDNVFGTSITPVTVSGIEID